MALYRGSIGEVSNNATWDDYLLFEDDVTGTPIDIDLLSEIEFELRDPQSLEIVLSGSKTGGEITKQGDGSDGIARWLFTQAEMQALDPKQYEVLVRTTSVADSSVDQTMIGTVNILRG